MYLSRRVRLPAFLSSFLHYTGRWPSWQAIPALAWVRLLLDPASGGPTGTSPAKLEGWSSSRTQPCPPRPPPEESALLTWGVCWSLKNHSVMLGPCPGDQGSIPGSESSPGGGHGNPLQFSGLENPMDRGAWRATVHGAAESQTRLNRHWLAGCRL